MTFDPVGAWPDPMLGTIALGLLWGLVAALVVVRRSLADPSHKRNLALAISILSVGASLYTLSSFLLLPRIAGVVDLGFAWLVVAGLVTGLGVIGMRAIRRYQAGGN